MREKKVNRACGVFWMLPPFCDGVLNGVLSKSQMQWACPVSLGIGSSGTDSIDRFWEGIQEMEKAASNYGGNCHRNGGYSVTDHMT